MGLRTASVRRPHATVMAPALTETSQTPSFTLPPNTQSASPINSLGEDNCYTSHGDHKNGTEHKQHLPSNCKDLSNVFDNLNTLALATELLKDEPLDKITEISGDSNHIMNNSPSSMGDHEDKMGLQKAGLDNVSCILKDKDVDQLFRNLSDIPVSDCGDIGNNVEDLMQVIKCMEGGAERLVSGNDIGGESEAMFPLSGSDLTGNLTSFEKDLFNEVDMMSMSMEEPLSEGNTLLKETQTKELIADVQKREIKLERKLEFLLRRLRKMQIRYMGQHFGSEVAGVFEHVHRTLRRLKDNASAHSDVSDSSFSAFSNQHPEITDKLKPISSSSAKNLVRKLEMSSVLQSNAASRRHSARYFGSGSSEPSAFRSNVSGVTNLPAWAPEHKQDLQRVAGFMHSEISLVQQGLDSEATASSSGGESCDEMQNYNNPHQQYLSIQKRAAWKYATERAAIAARWTWLQAQISDLEYRIRQHSDLHKQIRSNKGVVSLGGSSPTHSVPSSPSTVNGYRGQLPGSSIDTKLSESTVNGAVSGCPDHQCARTRPLINFRKRKLLQTNGLHAVSKKAARPSTIRCGCVRPSVPCALCTGRTDPTHPRDPSDYLSKSERISMLDPCFHPVFSLLEDCSAGVHLESIMKTPEWQQRSSRSSMKCMKYITKADRLDKLNVPVDHRPKKLDHRRKYSPLLKSSTVSALTAKIKNKFRGRKSTRHPTLNRFNKKRHTARMAMAQMHALNTDNIDEELESLGNSGASGKFDSPSTSPLLATQSISGFQRRNRVDSYDIDNIVIPYSVAAATRVEKLQYKEILTPKWRLADPDFNTKYETKNNGIVKNPNPDSDFEDLSEEAVILRHDKSEHDEKKKFLSYLKLPLGYGRSRSHKRTDSRAESSGANSPDPMSPHATDHGENVGSPLTSPPATPLSVSTDDNSNMSVTALRKRTASQSRLVRDKDFSRDELRCSTPEHVDVLPHDRRVFPLGEEMYEKMLRSMPEDHKFKTNIRAQDSRDLESPVNSSESKLEYHDSESTESAYGDEDPNDPEWMEIEHAKDRSKR